LTAATEGAVALAYGAMSALVPVVNAEVYAVAAAARDTGPVTTLVVVLALAAGQTAGKVVIFEAARLGGSRFARRRAARAAATDRRCRWSARIVGALRSRRTGLPLVLCSAAAGLPPLAAVSAAAGVSGQRRWEFAVTCLVGRSIRFAALALPAGWLLL
jgi:membrane protein YqaA with SNARE-associated domain